jgi:hypothetical protein
MRSVPILRAALGLSLVLLASLAFGPVVKGQIKNPIQAAKDAYNQAKQQSQQKNQDQQQGQQQPQSQQTQIASAAAPAAPAQSQGPISIDIVGIKPGMAANDAMQALKADNPRLKMTNTSIKAEGFANPLLPLVEGDDIAPNNVAQVNQASETIQVLLTTPPGQSVVWSVWRNYMFATSQRPSMQATIDALVKKYGTPTAPVDPATTAQTIVWVYDAQGKPMGANGRQLDTICESTLIVYNGGNAGQALNSDLAAPRMWPPQCTSIIIVRASVSGAQVSSNTIACNAMEVDFWDGSRYQSALGATRSVIAAAVKARQNGNANQVNSVPPPKL